MASAASRSVAKAAQSPTLAGQGYEQAGSRKWLVAIAVMLGATLEVLDTSIVNVSLPHMQGSFSASIDEVTWILTSYIVANGVMIPLTGWISTRLGRKRYFISSVVLFVIASGACGAARTLGQMVIFRIIQGGAGAAMIPSSQAILMETFPPEEQGLAMSVWGMGMLTSPMIGPTLGGWITDNWNWRWNFYINLPIGIIAAILVYLFVHDPDFMRKARGQARRIDYFGVACLVLGLGLLQIVLDRGQRADWFAAPWVCAFTFISLISLVVLIIHELRFPEPILDLSVFKIAQFNTSVVIITAMVLVIFGLNLLNPLFFQELLGYSAWKSGLAVVPRGLGTFAAMLLVGQLSRRGFDMRSLVGCGFVLMSYALWTMGHWNLEISLANVIFPMMLSGVASGLIFPVLSASALSCVERERMGYAASLYNMTRNTGSAIGISLVTNLLNSRLQVHQSYLGEHFTIFQAWKMDAAVPGRMPGAPGINLMRGLTFNYPQGFGMIYHAIQQQSSLLAFNDIYRLLALMAILFAPTFLLLRRTARGASAGH